jgi:hypothetical protein
MKTDDIGTQETFQNFHTPLTWKKAEDFICGERNMKKKTDARIRLPLPD